MMRFHLLFFVLFLTACQPQNTPPHQSPLIEIDSSQVSNITASPDSIFGEEYEEETVNNSDSLSFDLDIQADEYDPTPWLADANDNYNRSFFIPLQNKTPDHLGLRPKAKAIHLIVALCDVRYQGIAATPLRMANGQKPQTNLYWGAGYGVKNYFDRYSQDWVLVKSQKAEPQATLTSETQIILERVIFKHQKHDIYLVADAYDGRCIREATVNFIQAAAGQQPQYAELDSLVLEIGGNAELVTYVGHQGLMDFELGQFEDGRLYNPESKNEQPKPIIALACYSRDYFKDIMQSANTAPLVWTKSLMGPEAYILHDALAAWLEGKNDVQILDAGLKAIVKYQKYSYEAASTILCTGYE